MKVPITKPYFNGKEKQNMGLSLDKEWVTQGPWVRKFERAFSAFTHIPFAVAVSSGTSALHTAVTALGLKPGDEVIVPAYTWISTANIVEHLGAKPIFCDIELSTFNIDVSKMESLITRKTVGMIPVHLFGLCASMEPIMRIAKKHRLWVVEDAACALGAYHSGKHAGSFGEIACFSFHPRKSITTGEGGMIVTERKDLAEATKSLRNHGLSFSSSQLPQYKTIGFNYRMTDIQGALGCAQMQKVRWILRKRLRRARYYDETISSLNRLRIPIVPTGNIHSYQSYVCLLEKEKPSLKNIHRLEKQRNAIIEEMASKGIEMREGTHPPITASYYLKKYKFKPEMFPNANLANKLSLTLPLYPQMTDKEQSHVIRLLKKCLN